tara:strand:- start:268 stop:570 length:303 start_codon:yes stop_codon:yes gene_type:complete
MFGLPKIMIFFAILISSILLWATSNVCRYNFALEKKTEILNIISEEIGPSIGNAEYYTYRELNCNYVNTAWNVERVINNLQTLTVLIYQELNTDIKGDPN